jgi:hypothetical protein
MRSWSAIQAGGQRHRRVGVLLSVLLLTGLVATSIAAPVASAGTDAVVNIQAGAPSDPNSALAFTDVQPTAFYGQGVAWLLDEDITGGFGGPGRFSPGAAVTRAQMAAFLWRMMGRPPAAQECGFADIPAAPTPYYAEASCWLKDQEITTGYGGDLTRFAPGLVVNRGQMARFLSRLAGGQGTAPCGFNDRTGIADLDEAACWLKSENITTGYGGDSTRFAPEITVTRGQMAAFLFRLAGNQGAWEPDRLTPAVYDCSALDTSACLLPFPNDEFTKANDATDTGRQLALSRASTPANASGRRIDPYEFNRNDGFSPGQALLVTIPGGDLQQSGAAPETDIGRSLEVNSPIVVINADTGQVHPHWAELDAQAEGNPRGQLTIIRPAVNFTEGARYLVAIRNVRDESSVLLPAPTNFQVYRDGLVSDDPIITDRREAMEGIFDELSGWGIERNELYLAWDFTVASTRNLSERLLAMRDDAFGTLGNASPRVTLRSVSVDNGVTVVGGTVRAPNYLTGTGQPGSSLNWGPNGLPARNTAGPGRASTVEAPFVCVLKVNPAKGSLRPSLYGHGLLGLSLEVIYAAGDIVREQDMTFCAADWWGMSSGDIGNVVSILGDLSTFNTLADRGQQGFINFLYLGRAMLKGMVNNVVLSCSSPVNGVCNGSSPSSTAVQNPFAKDGGSVIDTTELFYVGNSQGGIKGGALLAVAQDIRRGLLGVPGMNYSTMLRRSSNWKSYRLAFDGAYPDSFESPLSFGLTQLLWDRSEANGYAHHLTRDPYRNTPAKDVLLFVAYGDYQVANVATGVMARTYQIPVRAPVFRPGGRPGEGFVWGLDELVPAENPTYSDSIMVIWDFGTPDPPMTNLPPDNSKAPWKGVPDPHGLGGGLTEVRAMAGNYLVADGTFVDPCGGAWCGAPR